MGTVTNLADHRAQNTQRNKIRIEQVAERLTRNRAAMDRLLQDMGLGWFHTCRISTTKGMLLRGQECIWCGAHDPGLTPDDAA